MAEILGRKVTISVGGTPIATARTKNLTINNEAVDVTSDGDDGIQRMLADPGQKSVELSIEGLYEGSSLMDIALDGTLIQAVELDYVSYTLEGDFFMSSYSEGQPYNEAVTFSATLMSSGVIIKGS
jgi:predicted secreted protein